MRKIFGIVFIYSLGLAGGIFYTVLTQRIANNIVCKLPEDIIFEDVNLIIKF